MDDYFFISHSSADTSKVQEFVSRFEEAIGTTCWVAPRDTKVGNDFAGELQRAITGAAGIILFLSSSSMSSQYVIQEIHVARELNKRVFPLQLDDTPLNDSMAFLLAGTHRLDVRGLETGELIRRVLRSFRDGGVGLSKGTPPLDSARVARGLKGRLLREHIHGRFRFLEGIVFESCRVDLAASREIYSGFVKQQVLLTCVEHLDAEELARLVTRAKDLTLTLHNSWLDMATPFEGGLGTFLGWYRLHCIPLVVSGTASPGVFSYITSAPPLVENVEGCYAKLFTFPCVVTLSSKRLLRYAPEDKELFDDEPDIRRIAQLIDKRLAP